MLVNIHIVILLFTVRDLTLIVFCKELFQAFASLMFGESVFDSVHANSMSFEVISAVFISCLFDQCFIFQDIVENIHLLRLALYSFLNRLLVVLFLKLGIYFLVNGFINTFRSLLVSVKEFFV